MTAEEIARILDVLGEKLGPAGERVYGLAVRYVLIDASLFLAFALVLVGGSVWFWRRAGGFRDSFDTEMARICAGAVALIGLLLAVMALSHVLNAEFKAIERLIGGVR